MFTLVVYLTSITSLPLLDGTTVLHVNVLCLLAGTGVCEHSSVAYVVSPIKIHYSGYQNNFINMLNKVDIFPKYLFYHCNFLFMASIMASCSRLFSLFLNVCLFVCLI